jgi:hypothetical protein
MAAAFQISYPKDKQQVPVDLSQVAKPLDKLQFIAFGSCIGATKVTAFIKKASDADWTKKNEGIRLRKPLKKGERPNLWAVQFTAKELTFDSTAPKDGDKFDICVREKGGTASDDGKITITLKDIAKKGVVTIQTPSGNACPHCWATGSMTTSGAVVTLTVRDASANVITTVTAASAGTLWWAELDLNAQDNLELDAEDVDDGIDSVNFNARESAC